MRRTLVMTYALAAFVLAGCGGKGSPTEPEPTPTPLTPAEFAVAVAGTWNLTSINNLPLPVVVRLSPKTELLSDQIVVATNGNSGSATRTRVFRRAEGSGTVNLTVNEAGTFTLNGASASFAFPGDTPSGTAPSGGTGKIASNKLTIGEADTFFLYVKQ